jgi:hypothetical protein
MAGRELPRKRLRERVAERKAREAERPTTFFDHLRDSVTPGTSLLDTERKPMSEVWRGYARNGGYILMTLSLVLLFVQMLPFFRGEAAHTNWMGIAIFVMIFLVGRALVFIAKFVK